MRNNPKMDGIQYGQYFINDELIREFIRVKIEGMPDSDKKEYFILKSEEGKVFPSEKTPRELLVFLSNFPEQREALGKRLHAIKDEINRNNTSEKEQVGSYFFVSAVISLINHAIPYLEKKVESSYNREILYPFVQDAVNLSGDIRCPVPKISRDVFTRMNPDEMKKSMKDWQYSLEKAATGTSFLSVIKEAMLLEPNWHGIGLKIKLIVEKIFKKKIK